jgi:flagellar hook assembly protein FlgD
LTVFNSAGEQVRVLKDVANQPAGTEQVDWDGKNQTGEDVASGVYLLRLLTPLQVLSSKVVVVR